MARREYKGAAPETELASGITNTATAFTVAAGGGNGYPPGNDPFYVVIDPGTANEEKILCTSRASDTFNCPGGRGHDDTVAVAHSAGAKVRHVFTKTDADEANAHVNAVTGVHGKTSALASLNDPETLTNKTISAASNAVTVDQSDVTGLVGELGAKVAKADVHDTWEAIVAAAPGTNWQAALAAVLGAGWPTLFGVTPGTGWSAAIDANLAGDWPNILDSPINGGWLNVFAVDPVSLRPVEHVQSVDAGPTNSTSYVQAGATCNAAFVAPPSGRVAVSIQAISFNDSVNQACLTAFEVREGVLGTGTVFYAASDVDSIIGRLTTSTGVGSAPKLVTGLTPGATYTAWLVVRVGGGNGTWVERRIFVQPIA